MLKILLQVSERAYDSRGMYTALSMRRAQSRLRSPTRSQVRSASAINRAGRLVIYHEWRSPED